MYPLFEGQVDVRTQDFHQTFYESCFEVHLNIARREDEAELTIDVKPEDQDGYEVLISYGVSIDGRPHFVDFDLWKDEEQIFSLPNISCDQHMVKFEVEIHEVLSPKSLSEPGPHRNFRILSKNGELFVNTSWLQENVGGSLFSDWYLRECQGESTVVPTNIGEDELDMLLKAVCSYSKIIVTRRTFYTLLEVGWRFKIIYLLRAIENYLLQARSIHNMDKLILAYKYRFAMLATNILTPLDSKERRKDALYSYLEEKELTQIPEELLEMLDI